MGTAKYIWQCLYKNQAVIDGRKRPWWIAVIVFVLSLGVIMIAPLTNGYKTAGASAISSSYENGSRLALDTLSTSSEYSEFQDLYFAKDGNGNVALYSGDNETYDSTSLYEMTNIDGANPYKTELTKYNLQHTTKTVSTTTNSDGTTSTTTSDSELYVFFSVYMTNQDFGNKLTEDISSKISKINSSSNTIGTANHSFILFGKTSFYFAVYKDAPASTSSSTSTTSTSTGVVSIIGSYNGLSSLVEANGGKYSLKYSSTSGEYTLENSPSATIWTDIFNQAYRPIRDANTWIQVGIIVGISAAIIILGGVVIWLFTLGKKNLLHKNCNIWEGIQMSIMASYIIAIITMAIYFMSAQMGIMLGIMCYVMRLSFLIMRTSGRANGPDQTESKPLYKARS